MNKVGKHQYKLDNTRPLSGKKDNQNLLLIGDCLTENIFNKIYEFFNFSFEFGVHKDTDSESQVWIKPGEIKYLSYLSFENCKGRSIYMRPLPEVSEYYMLVDDLSKEKLAEHLEEPGRMIVESSPSNYQVWIRSTIQMSNEVKKDLLKQFGSDPGAAPALRWGRAPGYTNRKPKHLKGNGFFPYAKLHYIDFGSADIQLPENFPQLHNDAIIPRVASNFSCCGSRGIARSDYECGDDSITDIKYCMALVKRGASDSEIKDLMRSERTDWQHHSGGNRMENYLKTTIVKARRWTK